MFAFPEKKTIKETPYTLHTHTQTPYSTGLSDIIWKTWEKIGFCYILISLYTYTPLFYCYSYTCSVVWVHPRKVNFDSCFFHYDCSPPNNLFHLHITHMYTEVHVYMNVLYSTLSMYVKVNITWYLVCLKEWRYDGEKEWTVFHLQRWPLITKIKFHESINWLWNNFHSI